MIDTWIDFSLANLRYLTGINASKPYIVSSIGGKEIKQMGLFFYKIYIDNLKIQDIFYIVRETYYDLIIGRNAVERETLKVSKYVVTIITTTHC